MNIKRSPERMCAACRKHGGKNDFVRIVKMKDGTVKADPTFKAEGRGAYLCANEECIALAEKKNALARTFKTNVDRKIYDELKTIIRQEV